MATSVTKQGLVAASDKVLIAATPALEVIRLFSTDFTPDFGKKGDAIAVNVLSAATEAFGAGAGFTHGTNKIAPATITLNKHQKSTYSIGDGDALDNELDPIWGRLAPTSGKAVATDVVNDVMALPTVAGAESELSQAMPTTLAGWTAVWAAFEDLKKYDAAQSVLVLTPTAFAALVATLPASVVGNGDAVNNAKVAEFLGFKAVIHSARLNVTKGTNGAAYGYIIPDGAIGVAARHFKALKAGGNLLESGTITDDATGFVMGTRVVVDADQGVTNWTVDCLYGVGLTKTTSNEAPGFVALTAVAA